MDNNDFHKIKKHLVEVYHQTVNAVLDGHYIAEDGTKVILGDDREMRENSRFYDREFTVNDIPAFSTPTDIKVINTDSISAGKQLRDEGFRPIVLNFANQYYAGDGVRKGSRAQESGKSFNPNGNLLPFTEVFGEKESKASERCRNLHRL